MGRIYGSVIRLVQQLFRTLKAVKRSNNWWTCWAWYSYFYMSASLVYCFLPRKFSIRDDCASVKTNSLDRQEKTLFFFAAAIQQKQCLLPKGGGSAPIWHPRVKSFKCLNLQRQIVVILLTHCSHEPEVIYRIVIDPPKEIRSHVQKRHA